MTRGQARILRQSLGDQRRRAVTFTGEINALQNKFTADDFAANEKMKEVLTSGATLVNRLDEMLAILDFMVG